MLIIIIILIIMMIIITIIVIIIIIIITILLLYQITKNVCQLSYLPILKIGLFLGTKRGYRDIRSRKTRSITKTKKSFMSKNLCCWHEDASCPACYLDRSRPETSAAAAAGCLCRKQLWEMSS